MNCIKDIEMALDIIALEDFQLRFKDGCFSLVDLQGANLGGIEGDTFDDLADVLDRMWIYHYDYFFDEEELEYHEYDSHRALLENMPLSLCRESLEANWSVIENHYNVCMEV